MNFSSSLSDALIGLRELFDSNWELLGSSLTPLVNAVVRLVGDEVNINLVLVTSVSHLNYGNRMQVSENSYFCLWPGFYPEYPKYVHNHIKGSKF